VIKRDFPTFLLYVLGFLLLWEWLRPLEKLTDTSHIGVFIGFLVLALALSYLKMKWIWQLMIKTVYIFVSINHFHYREGLFHFSWLETFFTNAVHSAGLLAGRDWDHLSNEFRTFLLFILLWLMVYLLHYWLLRRQRIFLFFFLTLIYVTVLDTFTPYNAKAAIVRTVVAGFAVIGMLTFYRMIRKEKLKYDAAFIRKWMVPLAVMIAFSVLVGVIAPKAAPLWPDPVPYLKAAGQKSKGAGQGSLGPRRIGYGANDDRLGGPFIGDNNPVFMYEAGGKTYWKVETKDVYTGKGWIPSGATSTTFREGDLVPIYPIPDSVEKQKQYAQVFFSKSFFTLSFLMYPAGIQRIRYVEPNASQPYMFEIDTKKEKITTAGRDLLIYDVEYEIPQYKASDLRKTTAFPSTMNPVFYENYTRLPQGLPPRIKQLTEKITAGETNWYDKAKAVERYFSSSDYTYDQKNVAVPGKNDDYVDQFLFETKHGYCDNFSTSMAVMLRTIGIPTRWVKGFTGGDFYKYSNGNISQQFYQVTNNNAHSWVEVFLPNVGWVPFEPTKGFSNDLMINYDTGTTPTNTQQTTPAPIKNQKPKMEDTGKVKTEAKSVTFKDIWNMVQSFLQTNWKRIVLTLILLAAFTGILYRIRGKWFPYLLLVRYRFKKRDETISSAYLNLLMQLERYGLKRKEHQTLRNYAHYVDTFFSTREMTRLTNCYEQYLYQRNLPEGSWKEAHELWENLIKKTIA
jgi:transglutaminase-like putative cysteine protease